MSFELQKLPNEIALNILNHVANNKDLVGLVGVVLSCGKFYRLMFSDAGHESLFKSACVTAGYTMFGPVQQPSVDEDEDADADSKSEVLLNRPENWRVLAFALVHHGAVCPMENCRVVFSGQTFQKALSKEEIEAATKVPAKLESICETVHNSDYRNVKNVTVSGEDTSGQKVRVPLHKHINMLARFATTIPISFAHVWVKRYSWVMEASSGLTNADVIYGVLTSIADLASGVADEAADRIAGKGYESRFEETYDEIFEETFDKALYDIVGGKVLGSSRIGKSYLLATLDVGFSLASIGNAESKGFTMKREQGIMTMRPKFVK